VAGANVQRVQRFRGRWCSRPAAMPSMVRCLMQQSSLPPACVSLQRYRALFALRNKGGSEAVAVLGEAFSCSSALLKHEVAYVFGQMQHADSAEVLSKVLQVREQLGAALAVACTHAGRGSGRLDVRCVAGAKGALHAAAAAVAAVAVSQQWQPNACVGSLPPLAGWLGLWRCLRCPCHAVPCRCTC
jgi:hypothetical protein